MKNAKKVQEQSKELDKASVDLKRLTDESKRRLRDKRILQMEQFPEPIKNIDSMSGKVAVSDKYARARIKLCELADELAENDADVVLSVLKM